MSHRIIRKKECIICKISFEQKTGVNLIVWANRKFCSNECRFKGRIGFKFSEESKQKIRIAHMGMKSSPESVRKMRNALKGKPSPMKGKHHKPESLKKMSESKMGQNSGPDHYRYISDRSKLNKTNIRGDSGYTEWRKQVWLRDNFTCKIANPNCQGRLEAHHILGWKEYPELRYEINNGITLCHAHHPHKRDDAAKLSPYFSELVAEMKSNL